jgi:hypothetical protein
MCIGRLYFEVVALRRILLSGKYIEWREALMAIERPL